MSARTEANQFTYITLAAPTTTQVKATDAVLYRININTPVSTGTITVYDNTGSDTTRPIAIITSTADLKPYSIDFGAQGIRCINGIKIVTATAAQNITVIYE